MTRRHSTRGFFVWATQDDRRTKSRSSKTNTITRLSLAIRHLQTTQLTAEVLGRILPENTGLAGGKPAVMNRLPNRDLNTYLALNWQRTDTKAWFTSKDRRFPTPQSTSSLFWTNQQRKAVGSIPKLLRNPFALAWTRKRPGGVGQLHRCNGSPRPKSAHENF
jgi:hypothetical protein